MSYLLCPAIERGFFVAVTPSKVHNVAVGWNQNPVLIDDLAARTAMSRRTFTRHFQKATGMTVGHWLVNERLNRSQELLESTSLSVERIAEMTGFGTATSFRQHFRPSYRVTPNAWRRTFGSH